MSKVKLYTLFILKAMWPAPVALWLLLFVMVLPRGCQEKVDWELETDNELRLVVQGKITNERKAHEVVLTLPAYEINGEMQPVSGAQVQINDGDSVHVLAEDPGRPGYYLTDPGFQAVVNRTYLLEIEARGYTFQAIARMEGVTPVESPGYYRVSNDPELYTLYFRGSDGPAVMGVELDWSMVPGYDTLPGDETHAVVYGYFFDPLTVDVNELFAPDHEQVRVPPGAHFVITKESVSDGYAKFLRGMLSETTWNGGLFDVRPGDPFTNLSEGAIGYFAACTVVRDSGVFVP